MNDKETIEFYHLEGLDCEECQDLITAAADMGWSDATCRRYKEHLMGLHR